MIIRKRSKPLTLQKYEALQARLPENSPIRREIAYEIKNHIRGYEGERIVDQQLRPLASSFTILQDVTLQSNYQTFQMDNLIITPHRIYIIEVKNPSRSIHFDTNLNQFTSGDDKQVTGYKHPITQVKTQRIKLKNWLFEYNQPNIPISYFIAIAEPSTIINVTGDSEEISRTVLHAEHIPWKIMEQEDRSIDSAPFLHQKLGHVILKHCVEFELDILKKHGITREELRSGVRCIACQSLEMKRRDKTWICVQCGFKDKHAGIRSLQDYFILVNPWITNRECKIFLDIHSRHAVKRILKRYPGLEYARNMSRWQLKGKSFLSLKDLEEKNK